MKQEQVTKQSRTIEAEEVTVEAETSRSKEVSDEAAACCALIDEVLDDVSQEEKDLQLMRNKPSFNKFLQSKGQHDQYWFGDITDEQKTSLEEEFAATAEWAAYANAYERITGLTITVAESCVC